METMYRSASAKRQDRVFAQYDQLLEEVAAGGATVKRSALFDLAGNWVPAKVIESKYGQSWLVLDSSGKSTGVFVPFGSKKRETQAKRGFVEGIVLVEAKAAMWGGFNVQAGLVPADETGTVAPVEVISCDRFELEVK